MRATGNDQLADFLGVHPRSSRASASTSAALARILGLLAVLYVLSSVFSWAQAYIMAGVTQRTVYRLREQVDRKLARLPLRYFDGHSRGDLLSRVTNDIDNIGQSLQQSLTQLITSLFTIIGVLIMMLTISPLLAVVSLLAVPLSLVATALIVRRSQPQFVEAVGVDRDAQRPCRGEPHRALDREAVRAPGRGDRDFEVENDKLYDASYGPSSSPGSSSR